MILCRITKDYERDHPKMVKERDHEELSGLRVFNGQIGVWEGP